MGGAEEKSRDVEATYSVHKGITKACAIRTILHVNVAMEAEAMLRDDNVVREKVQVGRKKQGAMVEGREERAGPRGGDFWGDAGRNEGDEGNMPWNVEDLVRGRS